MRCSAKRLILMPLSMLVVCLSLCHCGGGSDGGGPTEPVDFLLTFGGQITNVSGNQTLREIEFLLDGRSLGNSSSDVDRLTIPWLVTARAARGRHEFTVRLVRQTTSPMRYLIAGGVDGVDASGAKVVDLDFAQLNQLLTTGASVTWSFNF